MSTMREHLAGLHKREAQHHVHKAAHHAAVGEHYQKLAGHIGKSETTEASKDSAGILAELASLHESLSAEHTSMSAHHHEMMEECSKAADGDLNKLVPTQVSAITPDRPGIRAVPRAGQQPIPERPNVPEAFEHLAAIDS